MTDPSVRVPSHKYVCESAKNCNLASRSWALSVCRNVGEGSAGSGALKSVGGMGTVGWGQLAGGCGRVSGGGVGDLARFGAYGFRLMESRK